MCMFSTPDMPAAPQERQASRQPDQGNVDLRQGDQRRRRLAMASSIFTAPTLGLPAVTGAGALGA